MTGLGTALRSRKMHFSIPLPPGKSPQSFLEEALLAEPAAFATVQSLVYQVQGAGQALRLALFVRYLPVAPPAYVFSAANAETLLTALFLAFSLHLEHFILVIDNRLPFVADQNLNRQLEDCKASIGEELQANQIRGIKSEGRVFFHDRLLVHHFDCQYFDSAKEVNDLSCLLAAQAHTIALACQGQPLQMVEAVGNWFRHNITYQKTGRLADYSAVGLYRNKGGVCQGIAAYAYQLLSYCGLAARSVFGSGLGPEGWESHSWNLVALNGHWTHIDYTFALFSPQAPLLLSPEAFGQNHRWDASLYSPAQSDQIIAQKETIATGPLSLFPGHSFFLFDQCRVDGPDLPLLCYREGSSFFVHLPFLLRLYGGAYNLVQDQLLIYLGTARYSLPLRQLIYRSDSWYVPILCLRQLGMGMKTKDLTIIVENECGLGLLP